MKRQRFSKARLVLDLDAMAERLEKEHGFDPGNGCAQLKDADEETVIEYGKYILLGDLADEIEGGYLGTGPR